MKPAPRILRVWGIRHIRAAINTYRINRYHDRMVIFGFLPHWHPTDHEFVDGIRKGEL